MRLTDLQNSIHTPLFSQTDVLKLFPTEPKNQVNTQLHRMTQRGDLIGVKRGMYAFPNPKIDEFVVANKLYSPSYVSLESALNVYGIIPDIVANVTSVSPVTSKKVSSPLGTYIYSKMAKNKFFGFTNVLDEQSGLYYKIATPEKALLDFIYIKEIKDLDEARIDLSNLNREQLLSYATHFPKWVRKVLNINE